MMLLFCMIIENNIPLVLITETARTNHVLHFSRREILHLLTESRNRSGAKMREMGVERSGDDVDEDIRSNELDRLHLTGFGMQVKQGARITISNWANTEGRNPEPNGPHASR